MPRTRQLLTERLMKEKGENRRLIQGPQVLHKYKKKECCYGRSGDMNQQEVSFHHPNKDKTKA